MQDNVALRGFMKHIIDEDYNLIDFLANLYPQSSRNKLRKMLTEGRRYWPDNPFDALVTKPQTYSLDGTPADEDNEWTYVVDASDGQFTGYISHQRADNTRWQWSYNKGINTGTDEDVTGTLYERSELGTGGTKVLFK